MRRLRQGLAATAVLAAMTALALAGEVVVLRGGAVIELKQPWVRRGNIAYLTRADGTLLSVPVGEIDREATALAQQPAPPPPPIAAPEASTPAEAVRATAASQSPKARVRITDADVSHPLDLSATAAAAEDKDKKAKGPAKVEIAEYTQEAQGPTLRVRGQLRNPTQSMAENIRLLVTALDEKGEPIDVQTASVSNGDLESGSTVEFSTILTVGDRIAATLRFAPSWSAPRPTPAPTQPGNAASGAAGSASPPRVQPTPYGRGNIYAPPAANAPMSPQADGSGYIPNATSPENQPKPPKR